MSFSDIVGLQSTLLGLGLVPAEQLNAVLQDLDGDNPGPGDLLRALEDRHLLTPYQLGKLSKGQPDGLMLGNYRLLYRNASGSFARVYRACDKRGRVIALKVLRERWARDPAMVEQFHREAEFGMRLKHKNIVPIYEVGVDDGLHYLVMEFVEGGNLRELIAIRKKLSVVEATRVVAEICEGLEYARKFGITHRDMKMTNVLMGTDRVCKLVDFGLAMVGQPTTPNESFQRALEYGALERGTNAPDNDPRTDLYFVGAIYYELLTGEPPYAPTRDRDARKLITRYTNIRPIRSLEPNLPRPVVEMVERLMKIDPDLRYQRASEVIEHARNTLASHGEQIPGPTEPNDLQPVASDAPPITIMCLEPRVKQQDMLREYFGKHGFRVLVLNDFRRGIQRLSNNPPDCMLLLSESLEGRLLDTLRETLQAGRSHGVVTIVILANRQAEMVPKLEDLTSSSAIVLSQPISLRDIRKTLTDAVKKAQALRAKLKQS